MLRKGKKFLLHVRSLVVRDKSQLFGFGGRESNYTHFILNTNQLTNQSISVLFLLFVANDTVHMVDVGEQNVNCPKLLKYKSSDVSRGGNIIQNGIAYCM